MEVNETLRRVVGVNGTELKLHNVKEVDISGTWTRIQCDEGYVIINPQNVLAYIVKGEKVF